MTEETVFKLVGKLKIQEKELENCHHKIEELERENEVLRRKAFGLQSTVDNLRRKEEKRFKYLMRR